MANKYICPVNSYPNCRGHDGGYYSHVEFFNSLEDMLKWALENINDYEIIEVYNSDGKKVGKIEYAISNHRCSGITFSSPGMIIRTIDNGSGKLIWKFEIGE